jgi:hypothetical protein
MFLAPSVYFCSPCLFHPASPPFSAFSRLTTLHARPPCRPHGPPSPCCHVMPLLGWSDERVKRFITAGKNSRVRRSASMNVDGCYTFWGSLSAENAHTCPLKTCTSVTNFCTPPVPQPTLSRCAPCESGCHILFPAVRASPVRHPLSLAASSTRTRTPSPMVGNRFCPSACRGDTCLQAMTMDLLRRHPL